MIMKVVLIYHVLGAYPVLGTVAKNFSHSTSFSANNSRESNKYLHCQMKNLRFFRFTTHKMYGFGQVT